MYDPVFTDADRQVFQTLGMRCLDNIQASDFISGSDFKLKVGSTGSGACAGLSHDTIHATL